ncbi:gamma carbonic anhydrase family protein [Pelagibacterales bacterium SAG-MED32]|jgi:carbonic anhydrase/acetyltransferase-like protein (isoleucine patch superfamily)|nr:gamma carbonic anhydrase family protein [Pelagibacterales bacterium SAG-MED32]
MIYSLGDKQLNKDNLDFWVAPNAVVIGDVSLKKNASVWFGSVLRGDNDPIILGENSNIQDNSVCHTDDGMPLIIGNNVTVGHKVILHSCTVGDNSLIGMGSTVLNKAKIGNNCLVGANALVTEGKEFPDNSLIVGSPAKVKRELTDMEKKIIELSALHYVENMKRYKKDLLEGK